MYFRVQESTYIIIERQTNGWINVCEPAWPHKSIISKFVLIFFTLDMFIFLIDYFYRKTFLAWFNDLAGEIFLEIQNLEKNSSNLSIMKIQKYLPYWRIVWEFNKMTIEKIKDFHPFCPNLKLYFATFLTPYERFVLIWFDVIYHIMLSYLKFTKRAKWSE